MTTLTPEKLNEIQIWPWVKAICGSCRQSYWFKDTIPLDIAFNRIDCKCGTKATPGAIFCYEKKESHGND